MGWFSKSTESKTPPPPRVSEYLSVRTISLFAAGPSRQQVFAQLVASMDLPDPNTAIKAILEREEAGGTIIKPGFSLPHARLPGLKKLQAALGVVPAGVVDPRAQGEPIKLFLLFVGSLENTKEHLAFLSAVSSLFQRAELASTILQQKSPADILQVIRQSEPALH